MTSSLVAAPGAGTPAPIRRFRTTVRIRAEASGGSTSVLEHTLEPGCLAMPIHRHPDVTKVLHVLHGTLMLWLDGAIVPAPVGTSIVVPAGTSHTFWVDVDAGDSARVLVVAAPGGLERYYEEVASLVPTTGATAVPNMPEILAASARHGVEVEMESLYELIGRHCLSLA